MSFYAHLKGKGKSKTAMKNFKRVLCLMVCFMMVISTLTTGFVVSANAEETTGDNGTKASAGETSVAENNGGDQGQGGDQSQDGQEGQTGDQNQEGQEGQDGQEGQTGEQGQGGDQSQDGQEGQTGEQGQAGDQGQDGQEGQTGEQGQAGDQGQSGQEGQTGEQGQSGQGAQDGQKEKQQDGQNSEPTDPSSDLIINQDPDEEPEDDPNNGSTDAYVPLEVFFNPEIGTTLLYPLSRKGIITYKFGEFDELHPDGHRGLDLAIETGTPILAAEAGTVTKAEYYGGYGYCVFLDHGNGLQTRYAHMSELNVMQGDTVKRGQQIGRVGSTGHSTGPHLHFEVIFNGKFVNPILYIEDRCAAESQSVTVNGVKVTVDAAEGAFPVNWKLSVKDASALDKVKIQYAIDKMREEKPNIAKSYTFDIKILDASGNEVEPAAGVPVKVSFEAEKLNAENLSANVYHVHESSLFGVPINKVSPEALETETVGNKATVETDEFSFYTVEFTYDGMQYVLEGDGVIKLDDLLKSLGIEGELKGTSVSNPTLFNVILGTESGVKYIKVFANGGTKKVPVNNPDGKVRYVASYQPFTTEEWLDVTMTNGVTYHIIVTDAIINNGAETDNIPGVAQGIFPRHTQNIPLGDIWIDDTVLNDTAACRNNAIFTPGDLMTETDPETGKLKNPGFIVYDTESPTGQGHSYYVDDRGAQYFVEFDTHKQPLSGEIETKVTATGEIVYQSYNYFEGVIGTYKWENAAVRLGEDGHEENLDVFIEYSNPLITFQNRTPTEQVPKIEDRYLGLFSGNMVTIGQTADNGAADLRYGLVMDIKPYVKDKQGNIVSGNFYYPMTDLDVYRKEANFRTFYQGDDRNENYDETTNRYSETVFIDQGGVYTNSRGESLFIPGAEGDAYYKSRIANTNGEYVVYPGTNGGDSTPSQYTGFTLLAINDKFNIRFMGSSSGLNRTGMENYVLSGQDFNHKIRHSTFPEEGGNIQTTYEGNHSGELDDESGIIDPNILATSSGQTVVYTFYPKPGYSLSSVYVNSGPDCTNWPGTDKDWSKIHDLYSDKRISEGNGLGNTYQAHDDNDDGVVDRYTYTFRNIDSDNAIHVTWQKTRLTITKRVTGNAIVDDEFTFRIRAQNTEDASKFINFVEKMPATFTDAGDNWYTFTLKNFETLILDETIIPVGYKWEVEETGLGTQDGWTCIDPVSKKREGEVTQNEQIQQANFLNKRNKDIPKNKSIKVKKIWEGDNEDLRPKRLVMHAYAGMSTLDTGKNLRTKMITLAGSISNIKAFKKGTEAEYKKAKDKAEKVSVEGPPTYFWYDTNTIYFYSEADVYLNEKAGGNDVNEGMFDQFKQLADISGLAYVHTDYTEDFGRMFCNCFSIDSLLALQNWNTANAVNMYRMLGSATVNATNSDQMSYTSLEPISGWNVANVRNMEGLFRGAKITSVAKLEDWATTNVTNLKEVFFRTYVTDGAMLKKWNIDHVPDGNFKTMFCDKDANKYSGSTPAWAGGRWTSSNRTFERTTDHDANAVDVGGNVKPSIPDEGITLDEVYHEVQPDGSWLYEFEVPDGTEDMTWRVYEDLPAGYKVYYEGEEGVGEKGNPVIGVKTGQEPIELTNKRINRELTIGKALTEKLAAEESFEFTVKFWTGASKYKNMYDIDPIPADVEKVADGTYKFTLKTDGSSVVEQEFTDLPYGLKYEVTEVIPTGWRLVESYHASGVMDENRTASFLNGKNNNGIVLKLWEDHEDRFDTRPVGKPDSIKLSLTIKNYEWKQDKDSIIDVYDGNTETEAVFQALEAAYAKDTATDLDTLEKNIVDANGKRLLLTEPKHIEYNDEPYVCDKKADTRYVAFKVTENHSTRTATSSDKDIIFEEDDDLDGWFYEFPMKDSERIEEVVEDEIDIPYYIVSEPKETSKGLVFEVTNKLKEHKLDVEKKVTDPADDLTTEFNFAIKFWSEVDQYTRHPIKFMHSHFVTTKDEQGQDVQEFEYLFERGVMLGEKNVEGIHEKIGNEVISRPNSGKDSDKVTMKEGDRITEALRNFTISNADKIPASDDKPWAAYITMYDTGLTLADLGLTYGGLDSFEIYVEQSPDAVNGKFENGRRIDYFLVPTGAPPFSVRTPYTGLDTAYAAYGTNGTYHFKLKNGEKFDFSPLPVGVFYEIVEYKVPEWNLVKSTNAKGTLPDKDVTATFTNEKKKGSIKVEKETAYNEAGTFKFRAKILQSDGTYMDLSQQGATAVSGEEGVYEFTLANGKDITFKNIPINSEYEIWEMDKEGWTLVSVDGDESMKKAVGTIYGDHEYDYTFLNKGPGVPPTAGEDVTYSLKGKTQKGKPEFKKGTAPFEKFMLIDPKTGKEVETITIKGEGKYTVDPKTGEVTFVPEKDFVGTATKVTIRATDTYGNTADGYYTPHIVDPTENEEVKRVIKFSYEKKDGTPVTDSLTQTGTITRKALEIDPKTGKVTKWGPWSSYTFPAVKNPDKEAGAEWATQDIAGEYTVNGPQEDTPVEYIVYHKTTPKPPTPTGDTNNVKLWAGIMGISSLIAIVLLVIMRRKLKKK